MCYKLYTVSYYLQITGCWRQIFKKAIDSTIEKNAEAVKCITKGTIYIVFYVISD